MSTLNRRELLALTAASAAVAVIPTLPAIATPVTAEPPLLAWAVGTDGEFNWQDIRARTADEARRIFAAEEVGGDDCEEVGKEDCECDFCGAFANVDANRIEQWDNIENTSAADWLRAGMGAICSRCSYETFREENGHAVGNEAVCEECMTLADWHLIDPERAAELREQIMDRPATPTLLANARSTGGENEL